MLLKQCRKIQNYTNKPKQHEKGGKNMVDVEKILGLTTDERNVLRELIKLEDEAKSTVSLISSRWQFGLRVNEIDLTNFSMLGYKNRLTHDGRWILTIKGKDIVVEIDEREIYQLFEAEYLVKNNLVIKYQEAYAQLSTKSELCAHFRYLLRALQRDST